MAPLPQCSRRWVYWRSRISGSRRADNSNMNGAVIVACGRSAIGRARKGSLVDVRPDDLAAYVVTKVLEQVPHGGILDVDAETHSEH